MDAARLLRPGLLRGQVVLVAGGGARAAALASALTALGADVAYAGPGAGAGPDLLDEQAVGEAIEGLVKRERPHTVVYDTGERFAAARTEGRDPLRAALDAAWAVARAAATGALIEAEEGGKIVLIAPPPTPEPYAHATRAALENLSRTLSIEWARHGIRPTTIAPGHHTTDQEVAALAAYLASPAGDYFAGCVFSLGSLDEQRP